MKLQERIALITGGGRGIGRAIAFSFCTRGRAGWCGARSLDQVEQVAQEITEQFSTRALPIVCDVSEVASVEGMFARVTEDLGRGPDILVNNAGVAQSAPLTRTSDELWHRHLAINLSGTFYCTRAALPQMIERGWGRVINIASIAGEDRRSIHRSIFGFQTRCARIDALCSTGSCSERDHRQCDLSRLR
jgi:NAD(P)-dependent dehydrogenase (short-subunit alcohol dehydrogenase family)